MMFVFQTAGILPADRDSPDHVYNQRHDTNDRESTPEEPDDDDKALCDADHWSRFRLRDFIARHQIKRRRVKEFNSLVGSLKKNTLRLQTLFNSLEDPEDPTNNFLRRMAPSSSAPPDYSMIQGSRSAARETCTRVFVRVLFLKMGEIQTIKERYSAEVYVQSKWREPSLDSLPDSELLALDWTKQWHPNLFLENALGNPREICWKTPLRIDGEVWVEQKQIFRGTFAETLELWDFPFDVQDLSVTVTSAKCLSEVELHHNEEEINAVNLEDFVDEQEWTLYQHIEVSPRVIHHTYSTPPFSQAYLTFMTRAARRLGFFYWHVFLIMFLISFLAFTTFSVDPRIPEKRLQLSFLLILTSVNFKFMVQESLPRIPYLTYLDKYLLTCIFILGVVSFWHSVSATILFAYPTLYTHRQEWPAVVVVAVMYVLFHICFAINVNRRVMNKRREMEANDEEYRRRVMALLKKSGDESAVSMIHVPGVEWDDL